MFFGCRDEFTRALIPRVFPKVFIVGASLAGASLALRLAEAGIPSCVLDRATFPRTKPCGEGLSGCGVRLLKEVGIDILGDCDKRILPASVFSSYDIWRKQKCINVSFAAHKSQHNSNANSGYEKGLQHGRAPYPYGDSGTADRSEVGVGIERSVLDNLLAERLRANKLIDFRQGVTVHDARYENGSFTLDTSSSEILSGETGADSSGPSSIQSSSGILSAPYLIVAEGANSRLSAKLGGVVRCSNRKRCGARFHFDGEILRHFGAVQVIIEPEYQVCITQVSDTRLNFSYLCSEKVLADVYNGHFLDRTHSFLRERGLVAGGAFAKPQAVSNVGRYVRLPSHIPALTIGDSLEQLDPIGGMGMTHALLSAKLAAEALIAVIRESSTQQQAWGQFYADHNKYVSPLRGFTFLAYLSQVVMPDNLITSFVNNSKLPRLVSRSMHCGGTGSSGISSYLAKKVVSYIGDQVHLGRDL